MICDDLISFVDAELPDDQAQAFRDHLTGCEACREGLVEAVQLNARLSTLGPLIDDRQLRELRRATGWLGRAAEDQRDISAALAGDTGARMRCTRAWARRHGAP